MASVLPLRTSFSRRRKDRRLRRFSRPPPYLVSPPRERVQSGKPIQSHALISPPWVRRVRHGSVQFRRAASLRPRLRFLAFRLRVLGALQAISSIARMDVFPASLMLASGSRGNEAAHRGSRTACKGSPGHGHGRMLSSRQDLYRDHASVQVRSQYGRLSAECVVI